MATYLRQQGLATFGQDQAQPGPAQHQVIQMDHCFMLAGPAQLVPEYLCISYWHWFAFRQQFTCPFAIVSLQAMPV